MIFLYVVYSLGLFGLGVGSVEIRFIVLVLSLYLRVCSLEGLFIFVFFEGKAWVEGSFKVWVWFIFIYRRGFGV